MSRAEERLLNPPPGGRIEAARAHAIDLNLLVEHLRKTPEEHVRDLQRAPGLPFRLDEDTRGAD